MALPANPTSPSSPFQPPNDWFAEHTQQSHRNTPHGQKRRIDEQDEQAIPPYGGFKRLRISPKQVANTHRPTRGTSYHTHRQPTVTNEQDQELLDVDIPPEQLHITHHTSPIQYPCRLAPETTTVDTPPPQHLPPNTEDFMPLDDNPHRIFIDDLDAAIAEIEAEERAQAEKAQEAAFFLPDEVAKEISGVPQRVLQQQSRSGALPPPSQLDPSAMSQALILYKDPESISISEENDAVRKAVHEARQRLRERKDGKVVEQPPIQPVPVEPSPVEPVDFGYPLGRQSDAWRHGSASTVNNDYDDLDAMEIE